MMSKYDVFNCELIQWLENYPADAPRFHAAFGDTPYALISIVKRFGKTDSAPAKRGKDGAFVRQSRGFMGQEWDGFKSPQHYQEWVTRWGALLIDRVLLPGALTAFFGGSRTFHRVAAGLEDSGFEIVDSITWHYASGFPKSYNIAKGLDKRYGALKAGVDEAGNYEPQTPAALRWRGHGTALKPASEPIIIARAPRPMNFHKLAETYGTGALNIDGGRIPTQDDTRTSHNISIGGKGIYNGGGAGFSGGHELGRYPANVAFTHADTCRPGRCAPDCPAGQLDNQSGGAARFFFSGKAATWERCAGLPGRCLHPTMKPVTLTQWLATLLLPPAFEDGTPRRLLIPFSGVGSEMIGAYFAGWDYLAGVEMGAEYCADARARLEWWSRFTDYESAKRAYNHIRQRAINSDTDHSDDDDNESDGGERFQQMALF